MSLKQLEGYFKYLGLSLHLLANFINHLPFFVFEEEWQQFQPLNLAYQDFYHRYMALAEANRNRTLDEGALSDELHLFHQARDHASQIISHILQRCLESIKPEITILVQEERITLRDHIVRMVRTYEMLQNEEELQVNKEVFEKQWATLLGMISGIQAGLLKSLKLKHISQQGLVGRILRDRFVRAKELQHRLYGTYQVQTDFSHLRTGFEIVPVSVGQLLAKENYIDLILLVHLLKEPKQVCAALENKLAILRGNQVQLQNKIQKYEHVYFMKWVRQQRIIGAYQDWFKILQEQASKVRENDFMAALFIQQLLTYGKKAFLTKLFQTQLLIMVVNTLDKKLIDLEGEPVGKIDVFFQNEKRAIKKKVEDLETTLKSRQTYGQAVLATAVLGIIRQPEYQLGQLAAALNVCVFDQFPTIPIIGEQLSPALLNKLYHSVGLSFLSITMYVSRRFGYSYQMIAFINRILLAQIDILIKLGGYGDQITEHTGRPLLDALRKITPASCVPTIDWLKEALCFDELGIIEKDRWIYWMAGLGIQTGMSIGRPIAPALIGYVGGTLCGEAASEVVDRYGKYHDCSETTTTAFKVMAHFVIYSYAYSYSYQFAARWLIETEQMTQKQALTIFGLPQMVGATEIKEKYRALALRYHPDRCLFHHADCEAAVDKMSEINAAYQLLKKKFV